MLHEPHRRDLHLCGSLRPSPSQLQSLQSGAELIWTPQTHGVNHSRAGDSCSWESKPPTAWWDLHELLLVTSSDRESEHEESPGALTKPSSLSKKKNKTKNLLWFSPRTWDENGDAQGTYRSTRISQPLPVLLPNSHSKRTSTSHPLPLCSLSCFIRTHVLGFAISTKHGARGKHTL